MMSRQNAYKADYEMVLFLGKPALLADGRLDKSTIPKGLHGYELRHADEDWGIPCQVANQIIVNFYGTLLTNEAIQLGADGFLDIADWAINFDADSSVNDIPTFLAAYPPVIRENIMTISPCTEQDMPLYAAKEKPYGYRGELHGTFGTEGKMRVRWQMDVPDSPTYQDMLKIRDLKADLRRVIPWLRKRYAPLESQEMMNQYCQKRARTNQQVPDSSTLAYGWRIETHKYQYMLRCAAVPEQDNNCWSIFCYDKKAIEKHRESLGQQSLSSTQKQSPSTRER